MLAEILHIRNVRKALKHVNANKGALGIDGIELPAVRSGGHELGDYMAANFQELKVSILDVSYKPQPVRKVEKPKPQVVQGC